jgi:YesN/AraC family two-component response regulator
MMPIVSGLELADRIRELRPEIKVLFASGYEDNVIVRNGQLDAGVELLSKPFDRDRLAVKIREVLDREMPMGASKARHD